MLPLGMALERKRRCRETCNRSLQFFIEEGVDSALSINCRGTPPTRQSCCSQSCAATTARGSDHTHRAALRLQHVGTVLRRTRYPCTRLPPGDWFWFPQYPWCSDGSHARSY